MSKKLPKIPRRMPPLVPDEALIAAVRVAADRLCADLREAELTRALWEDRPPTWDHTVHPNGAVISQRADA